MLFGMSVRPLISSQLPSAFTDCWQQTSVIQVDITVLPVHRLPSSMHTRTLVLLWQPSKSTSVVSPNHPHAWESRSAHPTMRLIRLCPQLSSLLSSTIPLVPSGQFRSPPSRTCTARSQLADSIASLAPFAAPVSRMVHLARQVGFFYCCDIDLSTAFAGDFFASAHSVLPAATTTLSTHGEDVLYSQ